MQKVEFWFQLETPQVNSSIANPHRSRTPPPPKHTFIPLFPAFPLHQSSSASPSLSRRNRSLSYASDTETHTWPECLSLRTCSSGNRGQLLQGASVWMICSQRWSRRTRVSTRAPGSVSGPRGWYQGPRVGCQGPEVGIKVPARRCPSPPPQVVIKQKCKLLLG